MKYCEFQDLILDAPVLLVGNKSDQRGDRMVSVDEGHKRHKDIFCESFHEISVRESYDEVSELNFNYQPIFTSIFDFNLSRYATFSKMYAGIGECSINVRN